MSTPFVEYSPGDVISSEDLNAVRDAINRLEEDAWATGIATVELADGTRTEFSLPDSFEPNTTTIQVRGIGLTRGTHYSEGPGTDQITMLVEPPLLTGDTIRVDYLRTVTP